MKLMHRNLAGKLTVFFAALLLMLLVHVPAVHAAEGGRTVPYYNLLKAGGNFDGNQYVLNGKVMTDVFFFDGNYTYYLQKNGTPMKDRLTYHPDGEHIIYFDKNGHEVFTNFQYCESVGYTCYFDSQGYLYKDQITFVGDKVYYLNANGKMENTGWFQFANGVDYGWANGDGTLITTGFSQDPWGRTVFYHWNGMVARGLISDGVYYYSMDETDGHYLGQFPVPKKVVSQIESVDSYAAIEADVTLSGSGTGCHAKLVMTTPTSAVSYGIQYDAHAVAPYTGRTMAMVENVMSNDPGQQQYFRPADKELALGQTYRMMITYNQDGSGALYLDNDLIGTYYNPNLANQLIYLRVEASARVNGDRVDATFKNIKLKNGGKYIEKAWNPNELQTNKTISCTINNWDDIEFSGYISGLGAGDDWDNRYAEVSNIIQYN